MASDLRSAGIDTEIYFEKARLARQLRYASRKGFKIVVIPLDEELAEGKIRFKDMESGEEQVVLMTDLSPEVARAIDK